MPIPNTITGKFSLHFALRLHTAEGGRRWRELAGVFVDNLSMISSLFIKIPMKITTTL